MQYSDIPTVAVLFQPIFSDEWEISHSDFEDLQKYVFSKIPVFSQERIKPIVSPECKSQFISQLSTTYIFRITDFAENDQKTILNMLQMKLHFASKLVGNSQHVYEVKIQVLQKTKLQYHLWLTVQTETQIKSQKKISKLYEKEMKNKELLRDKTKKEKKIVLLAARSKAQNTQLVLKKLETPQYLVGDLRDWESTSAAS
jgi:hypothetical protein